MPFKFAARQDTGWGLIYRLNRILEKIENDVENGDLTRWNLHLDRVFVNIVFKNPEEKVKDEKGKIIDVKLSKDDTEVFRIFNKKIEELKKGINQAHQNEERTDEIKKKNELYTIILKKDIWVRKKMGQLKLYLREGESDPRKAIYGG
jgi:hypothetical protein